MTCKSKCSLAKEPHQFGHAPKMISTVDGDTYPKGTIHDQCSDCMLEQAKLNLIDQTELNEKLLAKAFHHSPDDALFDKFKRLKDKVKP